MKEKTTISVLIIVVIFLALGFSFYFIKHKNSQLNSENIIQENQEKTPSLENQNSLNGEQQQENKIIENNFSINVPDGWAEAVAPDGVSAMVVKLNEQLNNPAAEQINFRSYFAVTYDILHGDTFEGYLRNFKSTFLQTMIGSVFTEEKEVIINNNSAYVMEASLNQQGVDFKVLLAVVKGEGESVWILSFNTVENLWKEYENDFYEVANSFILKK
ncbi:hypothetical protein JW698_01725 [Candidatus Wolfebacteria bacterium]|nr:hypothetical protein [Candidatus Wolfebacteria bacterium]